MSQNTYLYEMLAKERHQDIQREVARSRVLSVLPRQHQNFARHVVSRFGAMLIALGTRLEQVEPNNGHITRSIDVRA